MPTFPLYRYHEQPWKAGNLYSIDFELRIGTVPNSTHVRWTEFGRDGRPLNEVWTGILSTFRGCRRRGHSSRPSTVSSVRCHRLRSLLVHR